MFPSSPPAHSPSRRPKGRRTLRSAAVFVTAFPEDQAVQRTVEEHEALWVVAKPWNPDQLCAQVNMALSLARLRARNKTAQAK